MSLRIGVDVGGTFTDFVAVDEQSRERRVFKLPSTPANPAAAIAEGLKAIIGLFEGAALNDVAALVHGTTIATNTMISGRWARTGLLTTRGFRDIIEIGRQQRPDVYDLRVPKPSPVATRDLRLEIGERVRSDGSVKVPLDEEEVRAAARTLVAAGVEAIAVCFLHSYAFREHETRTLEIIAAEAPDIYVTASADVMAEFREYPRVATTIINAALGPVMESYLIDLQARMEREGLRCVPRVMQSNGGIASPAATSRLPVRTLVSGPAAGVIGANAIAQHAGLQEVVTIDVGGTSTDVCLIEHGKAVVTTEQKVIGHPVKVASIDVHSIGAGGGSIAWVDAGGFLQVGPQSAGAVPGPACYGRGGDQPTVTDANVLLGRLRASLLDGRMSLDLRAAQRAMREHVGEPLGLDPVEAASAVIRVAEATMTQAIRLVSVERGHDPRRFAVVAYGGAGPLHVVGVARELGFHTAIVPGAPGVLSAQGLLEAPARTDFSLTHPFAVMEAPMDEAEQIFGDLEQRGRAWLADEAPGEEHRLYRAMDMRYVGQSFELTVDVTGLELTEETRDLLGERFREDYMRRYQSVSSAPVEAITFRVTAESPRGVRRGPGSDDTDAQAAGSTSLPEPIDSRDVFFTETGFISTPVYGRGDLPTSLTVMGPAIVEQGDTTTVLPPEIGAQVGGDGCLYIALRRGSGERKTGGVPVNVDTPSLIQSV